MKITNVYKITFSLALLASVHSLSAASIQTSNFATGGSSTSPDSITSDATSIYVEYGNGASSTGGDGKSSTIVRYNFNGNVLNTYSIPGSVDGLKFNTFTNQLWALQNQDGNSTVTVINPSNGTQTHLSYAATPANATTTMGNGFDDAVFTSTGAYLSRTNPGGDPISATLVFSSLSGNILNLSPVLLYGAAPALTNDPDSLRQDLNGNLVLISGDDGATTTVQNPGVSQIVTSLQLTDLAGSPVSGLDDTAYTNATNGTLLVTDTPTNAVKALYITGLTGTTEFASIGSLHTVGIVNSSTGAVTPIGSFAANAAPHGLLFVPNVNITATPEPATIVFALGGLGAIALFRRRQA